MHIQARFASDCLRKLYLVTARLETELGPGTGDLSMRFGLHSGAVTAGVLRGDRSRFQLFGDTMNTASVSSIKQIFKCCHCLGKDMCAHASFFPVFAYDDSAWKALD